MVNHLSLKLRITFIINLLLLLILLVSTALTIQDAKRNVHAEIDSSEKLALYLFEIGVLKNPKYQSIENEDVEGKNNPTKFLTTLSKFSFL